ncbi:hypothetical protein [Thomasclavelia sp.]|uniref:hypothetical protein n=1 Tax=Thomasclavelia sp. TaxID=3025757 RepID=UPI0026266678|nr:hypothetical protein [Thomasclavelia sp.]
MTLLQMIYNYQNNNDLDSLRDILEYLKNNPVYIITKIKISKKRLLTLPKDEIKIILENPVSIDNKLYFSIFSKKVSKYCLELKLIDYLKLMKKLNVNTIVIDYNLESRLFLLKDTIEYLKYIVAFK